MSDDRNWDEWNDDDFKPRYKGQSRKVDPGFDVSDVEVIRETGAAILVRGKGLSPDPFGLTDEHEEVWIPISQLHSRSEVRSKGDKGLLVMSEWIARAKGLL